MGGGMEADSSLHLYVNGGTLEVWASGDGLDSNGDATITGGDIVVYGPTTDGNGALDVNGTFEVTGGTLVATGSAGMMVAPSTDSAQGWIATALSATAAAGSEVVITDADGAEVATYTIEKDFASRRLLLGRHRAGRDLHRHRRRHRDHRHRRRGTGRRPRRPDGRLTPMHHSAAPPLHPRTKEPT